MTLSEPLIPAEIGRQFLCERANVVVLRVDNDGVISFANRYAKAFTGLPLEGCPLTDMMVNFEPETDLDQWRRPSDTPRMVNVRTVAGLPQTLYVTVIPILNAFVWFGQVDGEEQERLRREVLILNHETSQMSRELVQKNAELTQLNALKNQFLGMAAHDLRKPIGLIITYSDFLIEEAESVLDSEQIGFLNTINASCTFMKRLVDDFLDVSAIEAGRFDVDLQPAFMGDVLLHSLKLNNLQAAKKGIVLQVHGEEGLPRIVMDAPKIEQAITNLVSNAIEHTSPDSQVVIALSCDRQFMTFSVKDEGPGIPLEDREKLFKPFGKTSVKKTGGEKSTGLGMLITRKIIEAHAGQIWVDSQLGKGTTVCFKIPLKTGDAR